MAAPAKPDFCIVGIGASAGGLAALRIFFSRMPPAPGFACVVVVHLSPDHESHLVEVLQPYTQMQVTQVLRTTALEPNRVYVIPPNANLDTIDTHLRLSELEPSRKQRAPIDHFLRTLARTHGETAIGVILSGAGSDGALGIRQIKEYGGLTLAQDPQEAEYASMPQSAIATATVDLVLRACDMPEELCAYCRTQPWQLPAQDHESLTESESVLFERILGEVRLRCGQEFAIYKRGVVLQRIRRRMRLKHVASLLAYFEVLRRQPEEPRALCDDLLLNVTEFFRDADTIEVAIGEICNLKDPLNDRVRVWSIGSSTGEQAYSVAMLLVEGCTQRGLQPALQVFASELSATALQQAREGVYPQEIAATISQQRLDRFFVHEDHRYHVRRELRDVVTFATHDLFKDPPYSRLDLIVCPRLLRELQPEMRFAVLSLFGFALEPHGLLLVDAEDDIDTSEYFSRDARNPAVLRRTSGPRGSLELPPGVKPFARWGGGHSGASLRLENDAASVFRGATDRYIPPSVLVDEQNRVVHFSAAAARYLRIPGGELTLDIFKLAPEPIAERLRRGLTLARETQRSWCSESFSLLVEGQPRRVIIRLDPAKPDGRAAEFWLVLFDDSIPLADGRPGDPQRLSQLRETLDELTTLRAQLAVLTSASRDDATARDSQADLLREALEQLDGAREELQAINEELISVNEENQFRLSALGDLSHDLQHLLESCGYATLLLDRTLHIVRFTSLAASILHIRDSDMGRPLTELTGALREPNLIEKLRAVVELEGNFEAEVQSRDDRWYLVRAQPYRSALHDVQGVVVLFLDISARKRAELDLRDADRRKDEFLAVLAHELRNPLAPIASGIEVLRNIPEDRELMQRVVTTMSRQAKQLTRLVDDLLEVGRINKGKLLLHQQKVGVADVVRDALAGVSPTMEGLEHHLTLELPVEPLLVDADPTRLMQVISNLLLNAARYTPPRGEIALRVTRDDAHVVIQVQDNGRGIPAQSLGSIFEMFYQEQDPAGSTGLGIGLTLAKKLVEMHGGTLTAQSSGTGKGSLFTARLALSQDAETTRAAAEVLDGNGSLERRRILIVDDNADAAETLRLLMTSMSSSEIRTASSGPEALEAAAKLQPDIVLLDLSMPGMDGYEVARRIRAEPWGKSALLVALTGWGQEQHRRRSQEAGFDRHVTKPADIDTLRAVLHA